MRSTIDAFAGIYADMRGDVLAAAGPHRRSAQRVSDGARAARSEERVSQPRAAEARRAAAARAASAAKAATALDGAGRAQPSASARRTPPRQRRAAARRALRRRAGSRARQIDRTAPNDRRCCPTASMRLAGALPPRWRLPPRVSGCVVDGVVDSRRFPLPSFDWFSSSKKLGPLPEIKATVTPKIAWQVERRQGGPGSRAGRHDRRRLRGVDERHARAHRSRDRPADVARRSRQAPVGRRRRRSDARRRRHRQGRCLRVHARRQAALAGRRSRARS